MAFILAFIIVCLLSATAFRGTNVVMFILDIILLIFLTCVFSSC